MGSRVCEGVRESGMGRERNVIRSAESGSCEVSGKSVSWGWGSVSATGREEEVVDMEVEGWEEEDPEGN